MALTNLWLNLLRRNPHLVRGIRDLIAESQLTPEEREAIEREWQAANISVGKFGKNIYGGDVETLADAEEREYQRSLERQRDTIKAYEKDVEGSFQEAKKNAQQNSFFNRPDDRDDYINRVRSVAYAEFEQQRASELDALSSRYNLDKNQIRTDNTLRVLDTTVSLTSAVARDIGNVAGEAQNVYAGVISGVVGVDSPLARGIDTTDRAVTAVTQDITELVTASPLIARGLKKIRDSKGKIQDIKEVNGFLDGLHNVHTSWLRQLIGDFADVLDEWYHDPRTLCCFIKNIAAWAASTSGRFEEVQRKYFRGEIKWSELTGTRKFFDKLIAILRIIRDFLKQDIGFSLMLNIDLGLMMSKASLGAVTAFMMALQQMLEDTIYAELLAIVDNNVDEEWRQCFPFERLLRLIADFLTGPDGLFKYIEQYVDGLLNSFSGNMNIGFNQAKKQKMVDITAIDKLIALLENIRDSLLNLELCIEADFSQTEEKQDDASRSERTVGYGERNYSDLVNKISSDDSKGKIDKSTGKYRGVVFPTDNEVKNFITNRLGESESFANQVIATANKSTEISGRATGSVDNQGSSQGFADQIQKAIGDCSRTLNADKINELANLMANWNL